MKYKNKPVTAPGDKDYLKKEANKKEKKNDNYTRVTRLSYDEVDASPD
ncbi:MAG: hypothetical protein K9L17_09720 [Clostridiales bacterium]|nr:hypothetical protein [Clostridiales bacterium]MCF8022957.1 hypothetical protein [Clostridiales bacterium]